MGCADLSYRCSGSYKISLKAKVKETVAKLKNSFFTTNFGSQGSNWFKLPTSFAENNTIQ